MPYYWIAALPPSGPTFIRHKYDRPQHGPFDTYEQADLALQAILDDEQDQQ